jgi:hypothetical protein
MDTVDQLAQDVVARAASDEPLHRLSAAVLTAEDVRDRADELLDRFVAAARTAGRSWTEIGAVLGVTKQAAQQRYVAPGASDFATLLSVAERSARDFGRHYVGTEDVLLALLEDAGLAGAALARAGVDRERVRQRVGELAAASGAGAGALRLTPRTKRVLDTAGREASRLGQRCAGPEHVLLALAGERGGLAVQILGELGVTGERLRGELAELLPAELAARVRRPGRRRLRR